MTVAGQGCLAGLLVRYFAKHDGHFLQHAPLLLSMGRQATLPFEEFRVWALATDVIDCIPEVMKCMTSPISRMAGKDGGYWQQS